MRPTHVALAALLSVSPFSLFERSKIRIALGPISDDCTRALPSFPGVHVVGSFAHDRGCSERGYVFDGSVYDALNHSSPVLHARFSQGGELAKRTAALAWVQEAMVAGRALATEPERFRAPDGLAFSPPATSLLQDGGVTVDLWELRPAGMLAQDVYRHLAVRFDARGEVTNVDTLASVTRPIR